MVDSMLRRVITSSKSEAMKEVVPSNLKKYLLGSNSFSHVSSP